MTSSPLAFTATDLVPINNDIKYLFRTVASTAILEISLISDAPLLFAFYKTTTVTMDGNHLASYINDDTLNITASSKVYKQPDFSSQTLWKEILLTKERMHGTLEFKLRNAAEYVMKVKTYDTSITGNLLTVFKWEEGTN